MTNVLLKLKKDSKIHLIRYESIVEIIGKEDYQGTSILTNKREYNTSIHYLKVLVKIDKGFKKAKCHKWPFMIIDLIEDEIDRPWWSDIALNKKGTKEEDV